MLKSVTTFAGLAVLTALTLVLPATEAEAITVQYNYTLDIKRVQTSNGGVVAPLAASDDVQVFGSFTVDTDAADTKAGNAGIGQYNAGILQSSFSFSWGGDGHYSSGTADRNRFVSQIRNKTDTTGKDRYRFQDRSNYSDLGDYSFSFLRIILLDKADTDVFSDDSMPDAIDANDFNKRKFVMRFADGSDRITFKGNVTSWSSVEVDGAGAVPAIPLPATLPMFAGGIGLAAAFAWRRKSRA